MENSSFLYRIGLTMLMGSSLLVATAQKQHEGDDRSQGMERSHESRGQSRPSMEQRDGQQRSLPQQDRSAMEQRGGQQRNLPQQNSPSMEQRGGQQRNFPQQNSPSMEQRDGEQRSLPQQDRSAMQQRTNDVYNRPQVNNRRQMADSRYGNDNRWPNMQSRQADRNSRDGSGYGQAQRGNAYGRVYSRPPVVFQGRSYYTYNPYEYHNYRPYGYAGFHPFGYFSAYLGIGAFSIMINNQPYYYDRGVYYQPYNNGYQVVPAPVNAAIRSLPNGYEVVDMDEGTYYYYAGTFYIRNRYGFVVVDAPAGAVIYNLPEGVTEFRAGEVTYLQYDNTIYQPIILDGRDAYEVVELDQ